MIYRNDYTNKKPAGTLSQLPVSGPSAVMPSMPMNMTGCGGIPVMNAVQSPMGGMQAAPHIQGAYQPFSQNGNMTGAHSHQQMLPAIPAAGSVTTTSPAVPQASVMQGPVQAQPGTAVAEQVPSTLQNVFFTPGFLRTQIGRRMRVEFLLGTNLLTDRTGTLVSVGASYIVLRLVDSDDLMMCDIFSIKFVTILL